MRNPRSVLIAMVTVTALLVPATAANAKASEPTPGALAAAKECPADSRVLPEAQGGALLEGVVYTEVYAIGADCSITVIKHTASREAGTSVASANAALAPSNLRTDYTWNAIHTSQTLQDIINLDISRFRYAHETILRQGPSTTSVKFTAWRAIESWDGNLSWNHASAPSFGAYTGSYTVGTAFANASGAFHSDFLWCNLQAGQNFTMYTQIQRSPSGWGVAFNQSKTCTGTHMATSKKMNTTYNQW